jgi:hypothetical protein
MKLLRLLLVLVLALAIPLEGLAAVSMGNRVSPCTMQMDVAQDMAMPADHDCCGMSDADAGRSTPEKASPCKLGQVCQIYQVFPSTAFLATVHPVMLVVVTVTTIPPDSFLPSHDPSGLWRPPRSL